jgi:hypothetical protein
MTESPWQAPGELQHDHISLIWLRHNCVDAGASKIFLALSSSQQEAVRRQGGLGKVRVWENSAKLMGRIHQMFGFVDVMTATASQHGHDSVPVPVHDVAAEFAARSRSRSRSPRRSPVIRRQLLQVTSSPTITAMVQCQISGRLHCLTALLARWCLRRSRPHRLRNSRQDFSKERARDHWAFQLIRNHWAAPSLELVRFKDHWAIQLRRRLSSKPTDKCRLCSRAPTTNR